MDKWIALIRAKLRELRITQEQLGERVGKTQGGVGHWLRKTRKPDLNMMNSVLQAVGLGHLEVALVVRARVLNEQPPDEQDDQVLNITSAFSYPVSDWRAAGQPVAVGEAPVDARHTPRFEVTDHYASGAAFWLEVMGDAMTAPTGLSVPQGLMILVDPDLAPAPGKLVVARLREDGEAIFRQWQEEGDQPYLKALNPSYPILALTEECRIIGVAVQARVKF